MSVRPADVKGVARLQGLEALKVHLDQAGAKPIGNLAMQGPRTAETSGAAPYGGEPGSMGAAQSLPPGNWIYQGVPGVTDAWAPPSAAVAYPGDVPKAIEPH